MDRVNGFDCDCRDTGFRGQRCEIDVDECASASGAEANTSSSASAEESGDGNSFCVNGASCENLPGGYKCICRKGDHGQLIVIV